MHYYQIPPERLGEKTSVNVQCLGESEAVFQAMAQLMIETLQTHQAEGRSTVFIVPVGPVGQYPYFVQQVNALQLSLKSVWFINMDEYLTEAHEYWPASDPLSFRGFMNREVYEKIDPALVMPPEQRLFPDPAKPEAVGEKIAELGGVDICFGGIGINGHLAFNEAQDELDAQAFAQLPTRTLALSRETRTINAVSALNGAIDAMPRYAVTLGMREILSARKLVLGAFRPWHQAVVRQTLYGNPSGHFPATLIQNHPDVTLYLNSTAAAQPF